MPHETLLFVKRDGGEKRLYFRLPDGVSERSFDKIPARAFEGPGEVPMLVFAANGAEPVWTGHKWHFALRTMAAEDTTAVFHCDVFRDTWLRAEWFEVGRLLISGHRKPFDQFLEENPSL